MGLIALLRSCNQSHLHHIHRDGWLSPAVKKMILHTIISLSFSLSLCLSLGLCIYLSSWCISHRHTHASTLISNVTPLHPHHSLCAPIETPSKTTHAAVFCNHFVHMLWIIALGYLGSRVSHISSVMLFVCYFCSCNFSGIFFLLKMVMIPCWVANL